MQGRDSSCCGFFCFGNSSILIGQSGVLFMLKYKTISILHYNCARLEYGRKPIADR